MSINSLGQFGGSYPTKMQQVQRASGAMSNAIHSAGMRNTAPRVPYRSTPSGQLKPTGSPYGKQWGELTRQNKPGRDIWGGKEIPGLKYSGGPAQRRDYWHQMAEQPKPSKISKPTGGMRPDSGGGIGTWITPQGGYGGGGMFGNKLR